MVFVASVNRFPFKAPVLHDHELHWITDYLYKHAGIVLNQTKKPMVVGRLEKRLRHHGVSSYSEYFKLFGRPGFEQESIIAINLLTTNETYFFREQKHFDFIQTQFLSQRRSKPIRIWSAASSTGEEAYTLAMLLAEYSANQNWEILGTDISTRVLETARRGLYPLSAAEKIPLTLLKKYCLKGRGDVKDFFLIEPALRARVKFEHVNLIDKLPDLGLFDVIFLRNVMIYFDSQTKQKLLERIQQHLLVDGYFIVSHSESLNGLQTELTAVAPSIYCKKPHRDAAGCR